MSWSSLGSALLNDWNWKYFDTPDIPVLGDNTYKVKQSFQAGLIYPSGYFLLGWQCYQGGVYGIQKIYFDNQIERLINSKLTEALQVTCGVRYAVIKLPKSGRIDRTNIPVIEIFHWIP